MIPADINQKLDMILADPHAYGAPTFEEFVKDPEKFLGRSDAIFASTEEGAHILKESNLVDKQKYFIFGYECKNEMEVERVMNQEGLSPRDFEIKPQLVQAHAGKLDIHIYYTLKNKGLDLEKIT